MSDKYILEGTIPVLCDNLNIWGRWFQTAARHVARDERGDVVVSTVFLGLDHAFRPGRPLLFETMIFGGPHHLDLARYSTWAEATAGHAVMCTKAFPPPPNSLESGGSMRGKKVAQVGRENFLASGRGDAVR